MSTKQIKKHEATVEIPKDVKVNLKSNILHVEGPLGKTYKNFKKIPVSIDINDNKIILKSTGTRKKHYAILNTARSLIQTLCEGIVTGYTLKMKIVYSHFPITVKTEGKKVLIENFQGEKAPRVAKIWGETKVIPKTDVTQTAAEIELKTKIKNKDHRVFLDGIYRYSKSEGIEK